VRRKPGKDWWPIEIAPRDGTEIKVLIPYNHDQFTEEQCIDIGYWEEESKSFRFMGDDGPNDIQPTHWKHFR